jgi:hypothetical protein
LLLNDGFGVCALFECHHGHLLSGIQVILIVGPSGLECQQVRQRYRATYQDPLQPGVRRSRRRRVLGQFS